MFKLVRIQNAQMNVPEPEYLPCSAITVAEGEALVLTSGKLAKCGATTLPTFIAAKSVTATAGEIVPVFRVEPQQVWETEVSGVTIGNKYTLADDALGITTVTTSGVALVTEVYGSTAHVMFR